MSTNVLDYRAARAPQHAEEDAAPELGGLIASPQVPAWAVSLGVHLVLLFIAYTIVGPTVMPREQALETIITSETVEELSSDELRISDDPTVQDIGQTDVSYEQGSAGLTMTTDAERADRIEQAVEKNASRDFKIEVRGPGLGEVAMPITIGGMNQRIDGIQGSTNRLSNGTVGAADRLALEIHESLKERKTLVIWMLDASLSMRERREQLAGRIENIHKQLGQLDDQNERALKTAVVSFGEKTTVLTPEPVDTAEEVAEAIRKIQDDESGKEFVFSAIFEASKRWKDYRTKMNRNVMVIVFTDERGDDFAPPGRPNFLEEVIAHNRRYGIKVYCAGNAAIFGKEKGYVSFTEEDGTVWNDQPVDQGPETLTPELLQIAFWGQNSRNIDRMSASYGPYALSRLCAETNGLYLVTEESRHQSFDFDLMRNYAPDYRPVVELQKDILKNAAKAALVEAATRSRIGDIPIPVTEFRADNDAVLRTDLDAAQKDGVSVLDYRLAELEQILMRGEKDRAKITSARWRAAYDLAVGRVLAMRVRAYGYNATLAEMKVTPKAFEKQGSNRWRLVPSNTVDAGPQLKKWSQKATEALTRVINEHPGTPWATLAERELAVPMGWQWQEFAVAPPPPPPDPNTAEGRAQLLLAEEEERQREMRRKQEKPRQPPKL